MYLYVNKRNNYYEHAIIMSMQLLGECKMQLSAKK